MVRLLVVSVCGAPGPNFTPPVSLKVPADGNGKLKGSSYTHSTFPNTKNFNRDKKHRRLRPRSLLPVPKLVFLRVDDLISATTRTLCPPSVSSTARVYTLFNRQCEFLRTAEMFRVKPSTEIVGISDERKEDWGKMDSEECPLVELEDADESGTEVKYFAFKETRVNASKFSVSKFASVLYK